VALHNVDQINSAYHTCGSNSRLAQLVERVTSNDEVSRSSRLMGIILVVSSYVSLESCWQLADTGEVLFNE
jgi:hypothetical protein